MRLAPLVLAIAAALGVLAAGAHADVGPRRGSVAQEPGWYPAADPESASVRLGRRIGAPAVRKGFVGGARSLEELGRRICKGLGDDTLDSILILCVRKDEFTDILWREFPMSRPATGITAGDGWMFLDARLHGGAVGALTEFGGRKWSFVRFERYDATQQFRNFRLHKGLVLWARADDGTLARMTWMRAAVERKGVYKIYSMKD